MSQHGERSFAKAASAVRLSRRILLRDSALVTGAAAGAAFPADALAAGVARERVAAWLNRLAPATPEALERYAPVALTSAELTTLKAAIARLIPRDDLGPGAVEAGVFVFIDRALAGDNAAALPLVQGGLAALDEAAGAGGFAGLAAERQDDLLARAEAGRLAGAPDGFFAVLLEQTRRGMFGDPIHGGNRDFVGWDLIGYPGIKLVWTQAEQAIDAVVAPAHVSVARYGGTAS
jgi:gluconate 2-dehydrogenase gamma chain